MSTESEKMMIFGSYVQGILQAVDEMEEGKSVLQKESMWIEALFAIKEEAEEQGIL